MRLLFLGEIISGRRYEGFFKLGKMEGEGILFVGNGDYYEGSFHNNQFSGIN